MSAPNWIDLELVLFFFERNNCRSPSIIALKKVFLLCLLCSFDLKLKKKKWKIICISYTIFVFEVYKVFAV